MSWIFFNDLYYVYKVSFLLLEKFNVCHKSELFLVSFTPKICSLTGGCDKVAFYLRGLKQDASLTSIGADSFIVPLPF